MEKRKGSKGESMFISFPSVEARSSTNYCGIRVWKNSSWRRSSMDLGTREACRSNGCGTPTLPISCRPAPPAGQALVGRCGCEEEA